MSGKRGSYDAFDVLNQELSHYEPDEPAEEAEEDLFSLSQRQNQPYEPVDSEDEEEEEETGGRGCVGTVLRIILILLLAAALAWIVFMPEGSLGELWDRIVSDFSHTASLGAGLFAGTTSKDSENSSSAPEVQDMSNVSSHASADGGSVSSEPAPNGGTETEDASYSITVYRPDQIVIVSNAVGEPVKVFSCSSGKSSTPTQPGDYAIRAKYRWRYMVGDCYTQYASSFSSGYLFHSIPYNQKNPGTMSDASYDKLGSPASSGCVRLCCRDTKWIYENCPIGTQVHVVDENAPAGSVPEIIPERIKDKAHNGWDPTDESPDSPYNP